MTDEPILSEEENAALRGDSEAGSPGEPSVRGQVRHLLPDDWERIEREQAPALESVAERMASLFSTTLRRFFRRSADVSAGAPASARWGRHLRQLPVPTCLHLVEINPLQLRGAFCLDGQFVFSLVDAFFGGRGEARRPAVSGEFTQMEQRLVKRFVEALLKDLQEAWKPFIELEFRAGGLELNPLFAGIAGSSDTVSLWNFNVQLDEQALLFTLVLPVALVDPIRSLGESGRGAQGENQQWRMRLKHDVKSARVHLRAELARSEITLRELSTARPGDVIPIEAPGKVVLYAGSRPLMEGSFGVHQGRNAVRITQPAPRNYKGESHD
ncbi:MAG: FliM/FliN family flagellar motor switch protein [Chromatiales bacterium]|nr:FliM/FliN family flagellar motor switch protein [Chromatiales bacterium]